MALLILSDIHGNLEALKAVLADASGSYDQVYCLGDLVGYGGDPNAIVDWVRVAVDQTIRGNHDRVCTEMVSLEDYNPAAKASTLWTRRVLSERNREFLRSLPQGPMRIPIPLPSLDVGFDIAHGSPGDEDEYLVMPEDAGALLPSLDVTLTFFGHTHLQGGFLLGPQGSSRIPTDRTLQLDRRYYYLVNPGSVGQPRDRDPRAAYALFWPEEHRIEFRRVTYDVAAAAARIRLAGMPDFLADRLSRGA